MLTKLENFFSRYSKRLAGGSHTALSRIEKEWQETAEKYHLDYTRIYPTHYKNHILTLTVSSLEEAGRMRFVKKSIITDINTRIGGEQVHDITFSAQYHERT